MSARDYLIGALIWSGIFLVFIAALIGLLAATYYFVSLVIPAGLPSVIASVAVIFAAFWAAIRIAKNIAIR